MIVPVRKLACGNTECEGFGLLKDPDIWPAYYLCRGNTEFGWPDILCGWCDEFLETVVERHEEVLYGWVPGIAQFGAGPLPQDPEDEA